MQFTPLLGSDSCYDLNVIKFTYKVDMVKPPEQSED